MAYNVYYVWLSSELVDLHTDLFIGKMVGHLRLALPRQETKQRGDSGMRWSWVFLIHYSVHLCEFLSFHIKSGEKTAPQVMGPWPSAPVAAGPSIRWCL